ncbi:hypothetical protein GWN75_18075, partial [candidate division KSB1 bacterium]|nr:hypothetical protein [candidate division KSB1 bacterium]NIS25704.1 hypothetical protein [candidate division KSB1 bacterium]NIU26387.1 hypothetical protein [candidate division KSB1 bacterium]NIU94657.1 hypothetical protein [candidate division KSB1 bacterium]NIW70730.1 hypothetical protein [candidate division KSB1 bacterium]
LVNFAAQLLEENPWIWNHLYRHAGDSSEDRETIITLMALSKRQDAAFSRSFTPEEKAWYGKVHQ